MESYMHNDNINYIAVISEKNGKYIFCCISEFRNEKSVFEYYKQFYPTEKVITYAKVKNTKALQFFVYHRQLPIRKKYVYMFDFYKYVLGAEFDDKFRLIGG